MTMRAFQRDFPDERRNAAALYWIGTMPGILIIEDDDLMRGLLEEWLADAGYRVRASALREAPGAGTADLVIIDVHMPRDAGASSLRAVQERHRGIPMVAISGQFRPGLAGSCAAARALGVRRVIAKPFTREDLLGAVRAVVGPAR